jgi:hypothetical protein
MPNASFIKTENQTMATKDLITLTRAKQNIQSITDSSQDALISTFITAISDQIEKWCKRRFVSTAYDELYNGNGDRRMLLREYPIQSVQSVRYRPVTVLKVINNSVAGTTQQARVAVTSSGLQLTEVAAGVKTTTTTGLTFAGNVTLQALATAISGIGRGWSGQVVGDPGGDYGNWPSADLYVPGSYGDTLEGAGILQSQGAQNAMRMYAELKMHTYELAGYQWDARGWLLRAIPYTDPELLHPEDLIFPVGINNFRIQYTAGYSTIPEAVQEACGEWVANLYYIAQRDPFLTSQAFAGGIAQAWAGTGQGGQPPPHVQTLLMPYKRRTIASFQS